MSGSVLAVMLAMAGPASAGVIYSNLGPGDAYQTSLVWVLNTNNGVFSNPSQLATSFVPGADEPLTSVQPAVQYYGGTANQTYSFSLARDVSGRPGTSAEGAVLESWTTTPLTTGTTGSFPLLDLQSVNTPTLQAGQRYWLVMTGFTNTTTSIRTGGWSVNSTGAGGISAYINSTWSAYTNASPAFRINGTVPEPATLALLAISTIGLTRRRR